MKPWFSKFSPISWEGWSFYVIAIAALVWDFYRIDIVSHSVSDTLINFFPQAAVLFLICALIIRARRINPL